MRSDVFLFTQLYLGNQWNLVDFGCTYAYIFQRCKMIRRITSNNYSLYSKNLYLSNDFSF